MSDFIAADYPRRHRMRAAAALFAALVLAAVTARAGFWQLDRAQQKLVLQAQLDERAALPALVDAAALPDDPQQAAALHYRAARIRGEWVAGSTVFLENRQMNGRPGFYVVGVLRPAGSVSGLVIQRGWAARDLQDRTRVPDPALPAGEVTVEGRVAPPPARLAELGPAEAGRIRQNLDLASYSNEIGLPLKPVSIVQTAPEGGADGLARDWPRPAVDVHKHYGYAVQWFAMCALTVGLAVWFQVLRPRRRRGTAAVPSTDRP